MKTKVKTMQDLAAIFPDIYREHKLLCHAQKKAGSVVITVIDKYNDSFQVTGGTAEKAHENLVYWVKTQAIAEGDKPCES
ncbi:MAG: hypothetical protein WC125_08835 [Bacteroidales bacterium]|jgi:hypothetical protein